MRDVHRCVTVDYQQIVDSNIANQVHGFTIDYGKFILINNRPFPNYLRPRFRTESWCSSFHMQINLHSHAN